MPSRGRLVFQSVANVLAMRTYAGKIRERRYQLADSAVAFEGQSDGAAEIVGQEILDDAASESLARRRGDGRSAVLPPEECECRGSACRDRPGNIHAAVDRGQRAILHGVGRELVHGKREGQCLFGVDSHIRPGNAELALARAVRSQRRVDDVVNARVVPVGCLRNFMGLGQGHDTLGVGPKAAA